MKIVYRITLMVWLVLLLFSSSVAQQVTEEWAVDNNSNSGIGNYPREIVVDAANNSYILTQATSGSNRPVMQGDTVWVVVNHIKPDKRQQFERFVYEIFWPGAAKLDAKAQQAFDNTRVLNASGPEEDGTYTYVFLMDPVISGLDYRIDSLLRKMYPEARADTYMKMVEETFARESEVYVVVQSKIRGSSKR